MKVKCKSLKVDSDNLSILGKNAEAKNHFSITIGKEYVVFGLSFSFNEYGTGGFVQILSDNNHLVEIPIFLFDIIDNRPSAYWEIKVFPTGEVTLWPPSFYWEFYHDDLSEDVVEVVNDFKIVKQRILNEFS